MATSKKRRRALGRRLKWAEAIAALLQHNNLEAVAKQCGVEPCTVSSWFYNKDFMVAYEAARHEIVRHAIGRLQVLMGKSITLLEQVLDNEAERTRERLIAASKVLDSAVKGFERDAIEAKLLWVEGQLREMREASAPSPGPRATVIPLTVAQRPSAVQ